MPVLPIPMFIALILLGLLINRLVRSETHPTLLALIGICAVQLAIIALVQYYGVSPLRPLQAMLATVIPSVAWFAFERASGGEGKRAIAWAHVTGPLLALLCLLFSPQLLDVLIPALFIFYGVAMLMRMRGGEDSLQHSALESGARALLVWRIVALALIASAICDVVVAVGLATGHAGVLMWVPSLVSSLSLLSLGAVSLTSAIESRREQDVRDAETTAPDTEREKEILMQLDQLVRTNKPFLDPDLTLARLARRLMLPAKQLSAAINRGKAENVSRYINRLRIEEACQLLLQGKSVTAAMYDAGFNTKSNFNREFLRIKKMSPREWVVEHLKSGSIAHTSVTKQITETRAP